MRVGIIASLTGAAAEQGTAWHNGVQLAVEQINQHSKKIELIVEDDKSSSLGSINAFNKLAKLDQVQVVIGGTWDYLAESIYPLAAQHRIPLITPSNPPEILSPAAKSNEFVFTNSVTIAAEKEALKRFIIAQQIQSIAVIYSAIPWGTTHAQMLREIVQESNLKLIVDEEFSLESYPSVLTSIALKAKQNNPQLILTTFDAAGINQFAKELQRIDSKLLTVNTQHLLAAFELTKDRSRFQNSRAIYPRVDSDEFDKAYKAKFGLAAPFLAAHGYDALNFASQCIQRNKSFKRSDTCEYRGISGIHKLPSVDGTLVENQAFVGKVKDGEIVEVTEP